MYQIIKVNGEFTMREVYFVPWVPSKQIDLEPTSKHSSAPVLQVPVIPDSGAEERKLLCQEARSYKLALAAELARTEKHERFYYRGNCFNCTHFWNDISCFVSGN